MRHKCPVLTVKKLLKSVYIYGSYRKNKIGVPFFLDDPVGKGGNIVRVLRCLVPNGTCAELYCYVEIVSRFRNY